MTFVEIEGFWELFKVLQLTLQPFCPSKFLRGATTDYRLECGTKKGEGWEVAMVSVQRALCHLKNNLFGPWPQLSQFICDTGCVCPSWQAPTPHLFTVPPDHLLLDSAPNLGPLISHWEINKFQNCWYKSVRILKVLKILFQQFLTLSSSQRDMSGPILGDLSNNRWSGGNFE